jgi:hypothetical protein
MIDEKSTYINKKQHKKTASKADAITTTAR